MKYNAQSESEPIVKEGIPDGFTKALVDREEYKKLLYQVEKRRKDPTFMQELYDMHCFFLKRYPPGQVVYVPPEVILDWFGIGEALH